MNLPIILRVFKGEHIVEVKQFQLDQIVIGNQAEVNLNLQDPAVSPIHALIERRNETFYLCDLGSAQGTYKQSKQILDEVLESGDDFQVGPFRIQFSVGAPKPIVAPPDPATIPVIAPPPMAPPVKVAPPKVAPPKSAPPVEQAEEVEKKTPHLEPVEDEIIQEADDLVEEPVETPPVQPKAAVVKEQSRPDLQRAFVPTASVPEENEVIKASKGSVLEVSIGWKERIISNHHFRGNKAVTIGADDKADIQLPGGVFGGSFTVVDFQSGVAAINLRGDMSGELILEKHTRDFEYLKQKGRVTNGASGNGVLRLEQGEAFRLVLVSGLINVFIRYVPSTQKPTLMPFLPFTTGEIASVLGATALVGLLGLYNAINAPIEVPKEEVEPQIISVTKFVYPTVKPPPEPAMPKPPEPPPEPVKVAPPPPKQKMKVELGETTKAAVAQKSDNSEKRGVKNSGAAAGSRAAEAAPNKNVNAKKMFTSTQQGGGVKLGEQAGANASQTQKPVDLSTVGLTSTFGGGGARSKLAQAVQGAGGIIGDANQATGTAGFAKNRPGDDLGSAFKDTGAGGNGVATEGISGGITNGRGSGNAGYGGVGSGLGTKGGVQVDVGGLGASFVGTIDRNAVLRVIRSKQAVIRRCYEKELRFKKSLGGRVVVRFEIGGGGRVVSASIDQSSLDDAGVENCLKNELVTWEFPDPPANSVAEVLFPFNFQNKE